MWSVISTVVSNLKDFWRSQAFTCHVVPCTTFGKRSLKYKGSHLWNRLPESLKLIQSTPLFKSSLMVFLLTTVWTGITDLCTFVPFAPCTLHFAVNCFCVIVFCYNGWPAKMGFMPFWQPFTLCFVAVSFHSCIVVSWKINLLSLSDVTPQSGAISKMLYNIEMLLLQTTNMTWYMAYQIAPVPMTLSDLQRHSPVASLFECDTRTVAQQLTGFQLTRLVAPSLCDGWASG